MFKQKTLIGLLMVSSLFGAMPDNQTNLLKLNAQIDKIERTSFSESQLSKLFDGVASNKPDFSITTTNDSTENLIVKLKHPFYLRQIKATAGKDTCQKILVRYSKDGTFWYELDQANQNNTDKASIFQINGENVLAGYVAFVFVPQPGKNLNIQELEIYPEMDIRLKQRHIKDSWLVTDKEAFNNIDTKIDTAKFMQFGELSLPVAERFKASGLPVLEGEALSLGSLIPGTAYEYKLSVTDYNGNILEVDPRPINTRPLSLAYNKPMISGTFTQKYDGSPLNTNSLVLTDGLTDLDKSFAMSGSVKDADQFLVIDLGTAKDISEVVVLWRSLGYSKDFSLLGSQDNITWQTLAEHQNAGLGLSARSVEGHPLKVSDTKFNKTKIRYLKLLALKGSDNYSKHATSQLEIFEVKAF